MHQGSYYDSLLATEMKNYTHVKKVGQTSEFPFGIYWWTLKNQIKSEFWRNEKKKKCWRYHPFTHVYQGPQSYEVQLLRYKVRQFFFLSFWAIFCPLPSPLPHLTTQKSKTLKRCHHFKFVQQKTQTNDVCLFRHGEQQTIFCHLRSFFALLPQY